MERSCAVAIDSLNFIDLHLLICLFPVGAWFCIRELNDERVFIVLYAVFASYFAGVMIRLMLTLTPCVCVLGKIRSHCLPCLP